jgi:CheY-like chemotaxis protein
MQTLDGVHVLLVDDDFDSREVMKMILGYQGALVVPAADAKSALAILATFKPDVFITDISMPDQDGTSLVREARENGRLDDVPTLAVSAFSPNDEPARNGEFDAYLQKPVDPNELCTTVQALAHRKKPPSQR